MTAIACWINREEHESVWAVSDSRITQSTSPQQVSPLTDHCPKLFSIPVSVIRSTDIYRLSPQKILEFGFGFAGSTVIGINVKEILALSLSQLNEIGDSYPEQQLPPETYPSLYEIAVLAKKIAEQYMHDLGQYFPNSVRIEMVIYGFCKKTQIHKIIKLNNSRATPAVINIKDCEELDAGNAILLGDRQDEFHEIIKATRQRFIFDTINWWRSPFIALNNWINQSSVDTIGGYIQLSHADVLGARISFMTNINTNAFYMTHAGINTTESFGTTIGQFILMPTQGMSLPDEDGWDIGNRVARKTFER
ncbi:hypothetical protein [Citrobacter braakii]|uniref:hypothetical protein n=1 Tax=Citrobacter braakii TaxID=57706 RepID=UPI003979F7B9